MSFWIKVNNSSLPCSIKRKQSSKEVCPLIKRGHSSKEVCPLAPIKRRHSSKRCVPSPRSKGDIPRRGVSPYPDQKGTFLEEVCPLTLKPTLISPQSNCRIADVKYLFTVFKSVVTILQPCRIIFLKSFA